LGLQLIAGVNEIKVITESLVLVGLALVLYASLDLVGINILYLVKYVVSNEVRLRRRKVKEFIEEVLPQRLNIIYNLLLGTKASSNLTLPTIWLAFRESEKPGGKYVWGLGLILLDIPKNRLGDIIPVLDHELTHYIQDVEGIQGPRWYLEAIASLTEFKLHGRVRGYINELRRLLNQELKIR